MLKLAPILLVALCHLEAVAQNPLQNIKPIKSQSCLDYCPYHQNKTNNIIADHGIFILSQNKNTKFADWVAYRVIPKNINLAVKTSRYWQKDPKIPQKYALIPKDYEGAYQKCDYDRGHQAPLASFKGADWKKTNYVSNLTPQKADLNRGAWLKLENYVRQLVFNKNKIIYVITGTYYDDGEKLCDFKNTRIAGRINYQIPSGYWKIIAIKEDSQLKIASFIFPQNSQRKDDFCQYQETLEKIENITGLKFSYSTATFNKLTTSCIIQNI